MQLNLAYSFSCPCVGNGVVIHLPGLFEEGDKNEKKGISRKSTLHPARTSVYSDEYVLCSLRCDFYSLTRSERLGEETNSLRQSSPWCVQYTYLFIEVRPALNRMRT